MATKKNEKELLKYKENLFLRAIERSAESLGLNFIPKVKFWDGYCPDSKTEDEVAHIHQDSKIICVSRYRLESMTAEDIEETASHEVSHVVNTSHDIDFHNTHQKVKMLNWRPPHGTIHITERADSEEKESSLTSSDAKSKECHYNPCNAKKDLKKCKFCGFYFCNKHIEPKPPSLPVFKSTGPTAELLMEQYRKENAHPCFTYSNIYYKKLEEENKRYLSALDRLLGRKNYYSEETPRVVKNQEFFKEKKKEETSKKDYPKKSSGRELKEITLEKIKNHKDTGENPPVIISIILMIILVSLLSSIIYFSAKIFFKPIVNCPDGTFVGNCSINKPLFCLSNGTLVENTSVCGCPENKRIYKNSCIDIVICKQDGTLEPECSRNKPYQCINGELVKKASICGCSNGFTVENDECLRKEEKKIITKRTITSSDLHWSHLPISYSIKDCNMESLREYLRDFDYVNHTRLAFDIITNSTSGLVTFNEVSSNGDINIKCYISSFGAEIYKTETENSYEIGVSSLTITGNEITHADITLYAPLRCANNPVTQIHEILHGLGIEHTPEKPAYKYLRDVMYPLLIGCNSKIGEDTISKLESIYLA